MEIPSETKILPGDQILSLEFSGNRLWGLRTNHLPMGEERGVCVYGDAGVHTRGQRRTADFYHLPAYHLGTGWLSDPKAHHVH